MADFKTHCEDCVRELGEPFENVHHWLDEHFKTVGGIHRVVRHHVAGVERVREMWGDRAAKAATIHIKQYFFGSVPFLEEARIDALCFLRANDLLKQEFPEEYGV